MSMDAVQKAQEVKRHSESIVNARDIVALRTPSSYVEGFLIAEVSRSAAALRAILALCTKWEDAVKDSPEVEPMAPTILIRRAIIDTMKEG